MTTHVWIVLSVVAMSALATLLGGALLNILPGAIEQVGPRLSIFVRLLAEFTGSNEHDVLDVALRQGRYTPNVCLPSRSRHALARGFTALRLQRR